MDSNHQTKLRRLRDEVALNPESATAQLKLGTALVAVGLVGDGEAALRKAIELDPQNYQAWVNLGGAKLSRWDFEGCIEANRKALEVDPELVPAHFNSGLGFLYLGRAESMVNCFEKVIELDPRNAAAFYYLAVGKKEMGDIRSAQFYLDRAIGMGHSPDPAFLKSMENEPRQGKNLVQILEVDPEQGGSSIKRVKQEE